VGARLAIGLLTSFSGSAFLTSLELWAEPPPRPKEGEFPIADRRSGWAKDYTRRRNRAAFVEPEKLEGRTGFDLVRLSNCSGDLRTTPGRTWVIFVISGRTRQFEVRLLGKWPSRNSRRKKDSDFTAGSIRGRTRTQSFWVNERRLSGESVELSSTPPYILRGESKSEGGKVLDEPKWVLEGS